MFNNDERYWDINLLNKWFAISSIIFLAVTIWVFVDDNDDEFKDYQREFRKMEVEIAKKKLEERAAEIEVEKRKFVDVFRSYDYDKLTTTLKIFLTLKFPKVISLLKKIYIRFNNFR